MKYLLIAGAALVLAALAALWLIKHDRGQSAQAAASPVASARTATSVDGNGIAGSHAPATSKLLQEQVQPPRALTSDNWSDTPLPIGDFELIRPKLEARARGGDGAAAFRLAHIYRSCVAPPAGVPVMRLSEHLRELLSPEELEQHNRIASIESQCAGLGDIAAPDHEFLYWQWVERAADLGVVSAMLEYASNVIPSWPAVQGLERFGRNWPSALGNAERIIHYRDKAATYLNRALAARADYALDVMAYQYSTRGSVFAPDPVRAYAYALAFHDAAKSSFSRKQAVLHLSWLGTETTPEEIAKAQLLADDILVMFYAGKD